MRLNVSYVGSVCLQHIKLPTHTVKAPCATRRLRDICGHNSSCAALKDGIIFQLGSPDKSGTSPVPPGRSPLFHASALLCLPMNNSTERHAQSPISSHVSCPRVVHGYSTVSTIVSTSLGDSFTTAHAAAFNKGNYSASLLSVTEYTHRPFAERTTSAQNFCDLYSSITFALSLSPRFTRWTPRRFAVEHNQVPIFGVDP